MEYLRLIAVNGGEVFLASSTALVKQIVLKNNYIKLGCLLLRSIRFAVFHFSDGNGMDP